ncbi:MAG TPA: YicC family protein [Bacteroidales bacterium]|nr:YicC family protein [Bacteroidales bacterium]
MLKSMTGFGTTICTTDKAVYNIELKTINNKQADISIKLPLLIKSLEIDIRNLLTQKLQRGKMDLKISIVNPNLAQSAYVNYEQIQNWYIQLKDLKEKLNIEYSPDYLSLLLNLPGVIVSDIYDITEQEKQLILDAINEVIRQTDEFRLIEGEALSKNLIERIKVILNVLNEISLFEKERIKNIENRLKQNFEYFFENVELDKNRFAQEMFYYIEKIDITEEKVRLAKHCDHFLSTMKDEEALGRKLIFITQEMMREVNTIGAKANDYNIQHRVVLIKDELEKIREQLFNVL